MRGNLCLCAWYSQEVNSVKTATAAAAVNEPNQNKDQHPAYGFTANGDLSVKDREDRKKQLSEKTPEKEREKEENEKGQKDQKEEEGQTQELDEDSADFVFDADAVGENNEAPKETDDFLLQVEWMLVSFFSFYNFTVIIHEQYGHRSSCSSISIRRTAAWFCKVDSNFKLTATILREPMDSAYFDVKGYIFKIQNSL